MSKSDCPECDGFQSERVHVEWHTDLVKEVRVCMECDSQFTNSYGLFDKTTDEVPTA